MKLKKTCAVMLAFLCFNLAACNKTTVPNDKNLTDDTGIVNTNINSKTETISTLPPKANGDEWNSIGGSEDPYREVYGVAVSSFLVVDGTFTNVRTYYDEADQIKFYNALHTYNENNEGVPLMVHLIREMGITKSEYIRYLDAIGARYTDDLIDVIFSNNNNLINETFHSPLTLYHDGKIYTVYDLADMNNSYKTSGETAISQFPAHKIAELYNNIQSFNSKYNTTLPSVANDLCDEMAVVTENVSVD